MMQESQHCRFPLFASHLTAYLPPRSLLEQISSGRPVSSSPLWTSLSSKPLDSRQQNPNIFFFERDSPVAELLFFLPSPSRCWVYRCVPPRPVGVCWGLRLGHQACLSANWDVFAVWKSDIFDSLILKNTFLGEMYTEPYLFNLFLGFIFFFLLATLNLTRIFSEERCGTNSLKW